MKTRHALLSLLAMAWLAPAIAQDPDGVGSTPPPVQSALGNPDDPSIVPSTFGTSDDAVSVVSWQEFRERESETTIGGSVISGRYVTSTGGGSDYLYAALGPGKVPNGAHVSQILFYIEDSATANVTGRLCRHWVDSGGGTNPNFDCPFSVTSTGTPGATSIFDDPNLDINYRFDVDGDSDIEVVNYTLSVKLPSQDSSNAIRSARVLWTRQVSPAPGTATFGDVPTSSPLHQYVEALVDSGITAGCGGGNFCPNEAVTRGQMAVFLASALGLHWPAFSF